MSETGVMSSVLALEHDFMDDKIENIQSERARKTSSKKGSSINHVVKILDIYVPLTLRGHFY